MSKRESWLAMGLLLAAAVVAAGELSWVGDQVPIPDGVHVGGKLQKICDRANNAAIYVTSNGGVAVLAGGCAK